MSYYNAQATAQAKELEQIKQLYEQLQKDFEGVKHELEQIIAKKEELEVLLERER